ADGSAAEEAEMRAAGADGSAAGKAEMRAAGADGSAAGEAEMRDAGADGGPGTRAAVAGVVLELLAAADRYYASAAEGMRYIPWRSRLAIGVAARVYRAIGVKLRGRGGDALTRRVVVPPLEKALWTAMAALEFAHGVLWPRVRAHNPELHRAIAGLPGADPRAEAVIGGRRP
ncbi:MAG TPA: squalene/phytoene synthase family protein, partial [Nannocystis sp.]